MEIAFAYHEIADNKRVTGLLVHVGQKAYDTLVDYLNGVTPTSLSYDELKTKLKELFSPTTLEVAENFKFSSRRQGPNEDIRTFANALNNLVINCNMEAHRDKALLNQFVVGISNTTIQRRLMETKDLDYNKAQQIATTLELTQKESASLAPDKHSVNALHAGKNVTPKNKKNTKSPKQNSKPHQRVENKTSPSAPGQSQISDVQCYRCGRYNLTARKCSVDPKTLTCQSC